ncbi:MAG TPA: class I SAM-dependent methyltransferase [Patescibacteria group bacterium]
MTKWEKPSCNFCQSKDYKVFLDSVTSWEHKEKFRLVRCSNCGLVYVNPRPTKKYIGQFYPTETYWNNKADPQKAYGYLYELIFNGKKKKILDIGAGNGLFLSEFKKRGWESTGVEFSEHAVKEAKNFGLKLKRGDFLDFKFPKNYFDVVTLNNVLEHLYKPKETLEEISKVLKNNGALIVAVPNLSGVGFRLFGKFWYGIDAPRHLYQFNLDTLENMLSMCGFEVRKVNHGYWEHNYPVLFESFRQKFSPNFVKKMGGQRETGKKNFVKKENNSLRVIGVKIVCWLVAVFEPFFGTSEVVVVEARKI